MTLSEVAEAVGVVAAAREAGVSVGISFTVETDGRLPDGTTLREAVEQTDAQAHADWYGVNCAPPVHVRPSLDGGAWQSRLQCLRPNASLLTHACSTFWRTSTRATATCWARPTASLLALLPSVTTLGGCCGTDATHIAALWGLDSEAGDDA